MLYRFAVNFGTLSMFTTVSLTVQTFSANRRPMFKIVSHTVQPFRANQPYVNNSVPYWQPLRANWRPTKCP